MDKEKISAVYQIINSITGDRYVGSSRDVKSRWACHKCPSTWKQRPNSLLYQDFQKFGLDKFRFQILAPVMPEYLKQVEQEFIDMLQPSYNANRANGQDFERYKEWWRSHKDYQKEYQKEYRQTDKGKEAQKKYKQSDKGKEVHRKGEKKYKHQLCSYNGETLTLGALSKRFCRAGIEHPTLEARKYLIK